MADLVHDIVTHLREAKNKLDEALGALVDRRRLLEGVEWHLHRVFDRDSAAELMAKLERARRHVLTGIRTHEVDLFHEAIDERIRVARSIGLWNGAEAAAGPAPEPDKYDEPLLVSGDHVDALRARLFGDHDEYTRFKNHFDRTGTRAPYVMLVRAAYFAAIDRRIDSTTSDHEISRLVARARASVVGQRVDEFDDALALELLRCHRDEQPIQDRDGSAVAQFIILAAVIAEEEFDSDSVDDLLAEAREMANGVLTADQKKARAELNCEPHWLIARGVG